MCLEAWDSLYFCWKSVELMFTVMSLQGQGILEGSLCVREHYETMPLVLHGPCTLKKAAESYMKKLMLLGW